MILGLLDEATAAGAGEAAACEILGIDPRTVQRWRKQGIGEDQRSGPRTRPANKLSDAERQRILDTVNAPELRDLSPKQIVPRLADQHIYLASESTIYRVLREESQLKHREPSRAPTRRHRPAALVATGPRQVWSWDITYLRSPVLGRFFYLYMVLDVFSRKVVAWAVHDRECSKLSAELIAFACAKEGVRQDQLTIHADNGGPMKGATLLATLQHLGVATSFSRARVCDDNPYSEALFRTVKYRPGFPRGPFASLEAARTWVASFVRWYNDEHRHSAIRFVTPSERHDGRDVAILADRRALWQEARDKNPRRWTGRTRCWSRIEEVTLNPDPSQAALAAA